MAEELHGQAKGEIPTMLFHHNQTLTATGDLTRLGVVERTGQMLTPRAVRNGGRNDTRLGRHTTSEGYKAIL